MNLSTPSKHPYDVLEFPFAEIVKDHLGSGDLSLLHESNPTPQIAAIAEQASPLHRRLYDIGPVFFKVYESFVRHWVTPLAGEDVVFQAVPNFRFQMPHSTAVHAWHRDRDNGHSEFETNFWVPLTEATRENCVWIESREGAEDYRPLPASVGEVLVFDGANLKHGNQENTSSRTRVSFEFRVIPSSQYHDRLEKSPVMGKQFMVGDYFAVLP